MPSRVWSHLCDYAALDSNMKATIVGEFDEIFAAGVPLKFPLFFVITKWTGSDKETFIDQVRLVSPSRQQIAISSPNTVMIQGRRDGIGQHISLAGFMAIDLPEFGEYSLELLIDGNPVHILPLWVLQAPIRA
jgi:hypothetical protein